MSLKAYEQNCRRCRWYLQQSELMGLYRKAAIDARPCPLDTRRCYPGGGKIPKGERIDPDVVLDTKRMDWVCPNREPLEGEA